MKRILIGVGPALIAVTVIGLVLAVLRPDLVPALTRPQGVASSSETVLQCKEHGVPERFCTLCHKELKASLMLCKEHGEIPEEICTLCHPELRKNYGIEMCPKGHGLPKHFCSKCEHTHSASSSDAPPARVRLASADLRETSAWRPPSRSRNVTPTRSRPTPKPPTTRIATPKSGRE